MRLVSDFDGVWTVPDAEAAAQGRGLERALEAALPPALRGSWGSWLARARAAVAATPQRYGWAPGGRLSAFGDEDPFTAHSALLHYVHQSEATDPIARALMAGAAASGRSLEEIGAASHREGVAEVVASSGPALDPAAGAAGRALLDAGCEVAVVSNSPAEKLGAWFDRAGLAHVTHPARAAGALRLRGESRKFEIDPDRTDPLALGEIRIETARPAYERILLEERPDAVVGDVFSLDLALPLRLKRREPGWSSLKIVWLVRAYAPRWLLEAVSRHAGAEVECVEGGVAEAVARLVRS